MDATLLDAPVVAMIAPNGARKTQADHPAVPITPDELARCAAEARDAGAAAIHLHVRDAEQRHSLDADAYRAAIAGIRREVGDGLIVQATSEAVGIYTPPEQMAMVRAVRPESVSLAIREICADEAAEPAAAEFLAWVVAEGILPQYILYSDEDVARFGELRRRGIVPGDRPWALYVLGRYTPGQKSVPADLLAFLGAAGGMDLTWSICAFGARESACALTAAALGGHVRVGFENNTLLADGTVAPDNAALVRQVADGVGLLGRTMADAGQARDLLGKR